MEKTVTKVYFCRLCGIELDRNDVDANLNIFGVFKLLCVDDCIPENEELD